MYYVFFLIKPAIIQDKIGVGSSRGSRNNSNSRSRGRSSSSSSSSRRTKHLLLTLERVFLSLDREDVRLWWPDIKGQF